jgi:chemotaxis protein CheX
MRLARNLDTNAAAPLWAELSQHRAEAVTIDAGEVERLGGLCLQVLIAAALAWRAANKEFRIVNASPAFAEAARRMGAEPYIGALGGA